PPAPWPWTFGNSKRSPMGRLVFLGLACGCVLFVTQDKTTFRSTSRTVNVYATVQGSDGRLVPDLTRSDFRVFEDGHERPLTVFDNTPQAITVAVMFDMSNSMASQYERIRQAAGALGAALRRGDRARIGTFGQEVAISPLLTGDKSVLARILDEELWPGGPTPLWYATDVAMTTLDDEPGRRVVLLLTDGEDSGPFVRGSAVTRSAAASRSTRSACHGVSFPAKCSRLPTKPVAAISS